MNNRRNDNIIRVLHVICGMNRAGAESMIMNIYHNIDRTRFKFDFLVYFEEKQDFEDEIVQLGGSVIHTDLIKTKSPFKMISTIYKVIKQEGPYDVIHCATLFNSAYALIAALPFRSMKRITHSHNTKNTVSPSLIMKVYEKCAGLTIRLLTQTPIACGQEAGNYLFGKSLFKKKGYVLQNSVAADKFAMVDKTKSAELFNNFGLEGHLTITSVARFQEVKNHAFMIEIADCLKKSGVKFKMLLVGDGELRPCIEREVALRDLTGNIILTGVRSDIPEILSVSDVFLMPSFFEGNPVSLIEAQIAGCKCVISDTITDKIDLSLGLIDRLSLKNSPEVWVQKISTIKKPVITYSTIKEAVRNAGYDLDETTRLLCTLYEK